MVDGNERDVSGVRIIAIVLVDGESLRYLPDTLPRVSWWATDVLVAGWRLSDDVCRDILTDCDAVYNFHTMSELWKKMYLAFVPEKGDYCSVITAHELVVNHGDVRRIIKECPDNRITARRYMMWNDHQYRVDGVYGVSEFNFLFPYRESGGYFTVMARTARTPDYVLNLLPSPHPSIDVLSYAYAAESDRVSSREPGLLVSPHLREWTRGGTIGTILPVA